jgi:hypothetical protein
MLRVETFLLSRWIVSGGHSAVILVICALDIESFAAVWILVRNEF